MVNFQAKYSKPRALAELPSPCLSGPPEDAGKQLSTLDLNIYQVNLFMNQILPPPSADHRNLPSDHGCELRGMCGCTLGVNMGT